MLQREPCLSRKGAAATLANDDASNTQLRCNENCLDTLLLLPLLPLLPLTWPQPPLLMLLLPLLLLLPLDMLPLRLLLLLPLLLPPVRPSQPIAGTSDRQTDAPTHQPTGRRMIRLPRLLPFSLTLVWHCS